MIGLNKRDLWVRPAPSTSSYEARIKVDDIEPKHKGLHYIWELKPVEGGTRSFEIKNAATGFSIVGYDMNESRLVATPGHGSTWDIDQYHNDLFVIRLSGTKLVWTFDHDAAGSGHDSGNIQLRPLSDETHGQIWKFHLDAHLQDPVENDDEYWM
ncbi:hypothetical protein DFQ26_000763 [Actinomortierella ambigua]|nr:hypothetical protein DFQ26_000763 [Actinomortierella ambigua]